MSPDDLPTSAAGASVEATIVGPEGSQVSRRLDAGERIGRYVVLQRIGAGAMGEVIAAYDPELDRKVAVKLMRPNAFGASARSTARARLLREAQALARLAHPNVVAVHDVGSVGDEVFIAMEFVRGSTLDRWIEDHRPSWREVVDLFLQAARGLAAAHEAGLVHRDFKPKNVMVGQDGRVRVMDFGVVRTSESEPLLGESPGAAESMTGGDPFVVELTVVGQGVGTPAYMAPEQHEGAASDARADQFAFCVALFEALYRRRPFAGETPAEIAAAVMSGRVREPTSRSGVPAWVHRAIVRGLATRPEDRHVSMVALMTELDGSRRRSRWRVVTAVAMVAVVGVGVAAWQGLRRRAIAACEQGGHVLAERWGPAEREQARAALLATNLPYSSTAADTVDARLNAHVEEWSSASTQVCLHAEVDDDWPPELVELAQQCLAEQRGRAEAFIDLVLAADAVVTEQATGSAYGLASPSQCVDQVELARRTNLLRVGGGDAEVVAELDRVDRVGALIHAGKLEDARRLVDELIQRAEALDSDLLRARARYARGDAVHAAGDPVAAESDFEHAFFAATRLGYDELSVSTAIELAGVVAQLARFDEAARWAEHADAILTRLAVEDGLMRARLANVEGQIASERGDFELAVARHELAVEIYREALGPEHPSVAQALDDLGLSYFQQGRDEESFARLGEVLAIRERAYGPDHPVVAGSHNDLGVACLDRGDLERAEVHLRKAIAMRERFYGKNSTRVAASLANLAQVYDERKRYDEAIALLERALEIRTTVLGERHPTVAQILANLAGEHLQVGRVDRAQALYEQALSIQEEALGPEHAHTSYVRMGLADVEAQRGNHRGAVEHLRRAVAIREAGKVGAPLVASCRFELAAALWRAGDRADAVAAATRALAEVENAGPREAKLRARIRKWIDGHRLGKPTESTK